MHVTVRGSMYRKTLVVALGVALRRPVILHVHAGAVELEAFRTRLGPVRHASFRWAFRAAERRFEVKLSAAGRGLLLSPLKAVVRASHSALPPHGR